VKHSRLILAFTCAFSISCRASDTSLKKGNVRCPASILKGQSVPAGAILIGALPGSKKKLLSAGLITKSGSKIQDQIWDEETLYFEESPEGTTAETNLDTSLIDPYLKCSYPGAVDPVKKEYFDIQLLIPIRPHMAGQCKFIRSESEMSAVCEYKP
jgi:hypothetical protein